MYKFEEKKLFNIINETVLEILQEEKCIVAGGCITSLFTRNEINDIDVYFRSKESLMSALDQLIGNCTFMAHTDKATLFIKDSSEYPCQFIHFKFFNDIEELFNTFDFTACMGAYDFLTNEFVFHKKFFIHNSQRIIKFNHHTAYPIISALRIQKYLDKGYTISKPEFIKIMLTINNLKINSYRELKEQMGGMYGVNYDKIFEDIKDDQNFDINIVIERLSDLVLSDDYFNMPNGAGSDKSPEQAVISYVIQCYVVGDYKIYKKGFKKGIFGNELNSYYIILKENTIVKIIESEDMDIDASRLSTDDNEIIVYKNVKQSGDKYVSFQDNNFEYRLGEEIAAKNERGLFFVESLLNVTNACHSNNEDRVILKAKVSINNMINDLQFTKCVPLEIINEGR